MLRTTSECWASQLIFVLLQRDALICWGSGSRKRAGIFVTTRKTRDAVHVALLPAFPESAV